MSNGFPAVVVVVVGYFLVIIFVLLLLLCYCSVALSVGFLAVMYVTFAVLSVGLCLSRYRVV